MTLNFKLKYSYILKLIYGLAIIAFMVGAYLLIKFLYANFYQVIAQTDDIIVLRNEVSTEMVDVALFEKIFVRLNEKQKSLPFDVKNIKNIFGSPLEQ